MFKKIFTKEFYKDKRNILWLVLFSAAVALLITAIVLLVNFLVPQKPTNEYEKYKNPVVDVVDELPANPINFEAAQAENPEICAWIQIDGIDVIDYPILQSGENRQEDFYLDHNVKGESARTGAIYIQKYNNKDITDRNTIIYGHNMLNGTMFGQLKKFRNKNFFEENRYIHLYTPGHAYKYEILSAFAYDDRHLLNAFNFSTTEDFQAFINECKSPTSLTRQVREELEVGLSDRLITLSTCTSNETERYLIVAVMVEDTLTK